MTNFDNLPPPDDFMPETQKKRTQTVQCRITPQQKEALDRIADRQGLSRSDFLLMALSDYVLKVCNEYERQQNFVSSDCSSEGAAGGTNAPRQHHG